MPRTIAERMLRADGSFFRPPRAAETPSRSPPPMSQRIAMTHIGGMVSTDWRMKK